ncbi:MAG: ADP-ribosylglycohydrolase family protein [Myxococcota bacterium]
MTTPDERARGALWGQAVGDALGTTVEFQDEFEIATRASSRWPDELIGQGPFRLLPGQITDDTELALALARSLVRRGTYDAEDVAQAYLRWYQSGPFDCGFATRQAFGAPAKSADELRARASRQTQANGSLMRSSPLGLFGAALPRGELGALAAADSTLSHPDPVCQAACAVFVTTIADAITTGESGERLFSRALEFSAGGPVEDTLRAAREGLPRSDGDDQGWVRIALQHAFFHLLHATDFRAALVQTATRGGDTDTNAAIAGALLGARLGVEAIPASWRAAVRDCRPQRPAEYRCADLDVLALALLR